MARMFVIKNLSENVEYFHYRRVTEEGLSRCSTRTKQKKDERGNSIK